MESELHRKSFFGINLSYENKKSLKKSMQEKIQSAGTPKKLLTRLPRPTPLDSYVFFFSRFGVNDLIVVKFVLGCNWYLSLFVQIRKELSVAEKV